MSFAEFVANPMAPILVIFLVIMAVFCVALLCQSNEPTPEYTRIMAEVAARRAEWEAGQPARMEAYKLAREARWAQMRAESAARVAAMIAADKAKDI